MPSFKTSIFKFKKNHPLAKINFPVHPGDVGYDICTTESKWVWPFFPVALHTHIHFELPKGYFANIRTRSGHGIKNHLRVHPGTIDTAYRGEVSVTVYNLGIFPYKVKVGEKIAQVVLQSSVVLPLQEISTLTETKRGTKGFGSTGK